MPWVRRRTHGTAARRTAAEWHRSSERGERTGRARAPPVTSGWAGGTTRAGPPGAPPTAHAARHHPHHIASVQVTAHDNGIQRRVAITPRRTVH
ncbi:hypothetical protein GCM10023324_21850 [Streptomyces youssoufiensis]